MPVVFTKTVLTTPRLPETKMKSTTRAALTTAIASLLLIAACDVGDEYTDDGQLVEKTNVRVTGVSFGRVADSAGHLLDEADTFARTDTIYASVRTKGSSPQTVLGVQWINPAGDDFVRGNTIIRPTGDTSTLFRLRPMVPLNPGHYKLEMRVNGKVVKTAGFTVSAAVEPYPAAGAARPAKLKSGIAAVRPFVRKTFARLANSVRDVFERAPADQSPFEWKGLRAGMRFSKLDRLSRPGSDWKCTPFFLSAVGLERGIARESEDFGAGHVRAMVDTVDHRVFTIGYQVMWTAPNEPQKVRFEQELNALATKWDNIPGVKRHPREDHGQGPSLARWETADSTWSAQISYYQGANGAVRPAGFEIAEINWGDRLSAEIPDSIKGQMHNPESPYYRNMTPTGGCPALLQSP